MSNRLDGDTYCTGALSMVGLAAPANCIGNFNVSASDPLGQTKLQQQYKRYIAQDHGVAAVTKRSVIHIAQAAGSVYRLRAGLVVPNVGAATVTIDLRKNGVTILSSLITLGVTAAYVTIDGSVLTSTYVAGDVFEVLVTATASGGTLGQGLFVDTMFRELPG